MGGELIGKISAIHSLQLIVPHESLYGLIHFAYDVGPTLKQHCLNVSCLLGIIN